MRSLSFLSILFLFSFSLIAQKGTIRGKVISAKDGQSIMGATAIIESHSYAAYTDLDGEFTLQVDPGTYELSIVLFSYSTVTIKEVTVKAGEVVALGEIQMSASQTELDEVVISVSKLKNTEAAVLKEKKNASNLMDGISAASFKKIGDSDAASSMKRVPGVSVQGGKYIYVRGLGDRYNKTILNGVDIPGLDPDKNSIQMDIFPTNLIDNIIVSKSFSADLPANFAGGVVNINLKDFPEKQTGGISVGAGYNPLFHFNNEYLTYEGGSTDYLGFDDGTRAIPATDNIPGTITDAFASPEAKERYIDILNSFNPNLAAFQQRSNMDFSIGGDYGNQIKLKKYSIGYNFALSYKNETQFYQDAIYARYGLKADPSINEMETRLFQQGDFGVNNVLISSLGGFAIKTQKSKISLNAIHLQNGESKAGIFDFESLDQGANFNGFQHNLEYSEKRLTNLLLDGKHNLGNDKWEVVWKLSPTFSGIDDPDIRFTRYQERDQDLNIGTESGFPVRIWRNMEETNLSGVTHITKKFKFNEKDAKLKFGGAYTFKDRDYVIRNFNLNIRNVELTGNPNELFFEENIWPIDGDNSRGTTYEAQFLPNNPNQFNSNNSYIAGYASTEINFLKNLKSIIGLRVESFTQRYTGQDQLGINVLRNDIVIDDIDLFPTLNLVYELTEKQNLRFSYAKTIARPSFKEMSFAEIFDPITGNVFVGGLFEDGDNWDGNLISSDIHNLDARWEIFQKKAQTISLSTFYKKFFNPIEIVQFATQSGAFQPRNVGDGDVLGIELEMRQSLEKINKSLKNFSATFNFTVIESRIEMNKTEFDSRVNNKREGQEIDRYRDMAGQAPYLINGGISYNGGEKKFWKGLEFGIYYNVQGPTLQFVGMVDRPDIYSVPFHSMNFNLNKTFGKNDQMKFGLKVANLLNDKVESVYKSFNAEDQFFSQLNPGINASLKFGYTF